MAALLLFIFMVGLAVPDAGALRASVLWHGQGKFLQVSPQNPNAKPRLQPLPKTPIVNVLIQGAWQLDGLNCVGCRFRDAILRYSGGPFRCRQCWIEGDLTMTFSGAAGNALAVNQWVTRLGASARAILVPIPAVTGTVHLKQPLQVDLVSPAMPR